MSQWDGKSKGTVLGYKIFLFFIKAFGIGSAYFILHFVSFYYYLFAKKNKKPIVNFYKQGLNYSDKEANHLTRKNFFIFGQTLVDRHAFLVGKGNKFTYSFQNEKYLLEIQKNGKGGVLLSAHLGNWETAGNLLKERVSSKINVLMLDVEMEKIKKYLNNSTGGSQFNIIPIKNDLSHVISINNVLRDNELVAIHADRCMEGSKSLEISFLGRKAKFPLGPFIIASKFDAPISFVYALKEKNYHYALSATLPITQKLKPEEIAQKYVEELEKKVKQYPEQWFNYFDFYQQ